MDVWLVREFEKEYFLNVVSIPNEVIFMSTRGASGTKFIPENEDKRNSRLSVIYTFILWSEVRLIFPSLQFTCFS